MDYKIIVETIAGIVAAYLVGAVPFGYLIVRFAKGTDIRTVGSGSTGATNVLRVAGPVAAGATVMGDFFKGVIVIVVARVVGLPALSIVFVALAVLAGHNWPVFLKFKGGRGVATGFGVSLGLTWQISTALFILWGILIAATGYVSLASVVVMAIYPVMVFYFHEPAPILVLAAIGAWTVVFMHRKNIVRLIKGTEPKLGQKAKEKN